MTNPLEIIFTTIVGGLGWPLIIILATMSVAAILLKAANTGSKKPSGTGLDGCKVSVQPLMSKEQAKVFSALQSFAHAHDLILHAEVSLAAFLKVTSPGDRKRAFSGFGTFRQKRVDILLTDRNHKPVCGIEYHGSGHWNGNAKKRDAAKRLAFDTAGLPLVEVRQGENLNLLPKRVAEAIRATGGQSVGHNTGKKPPFKRAA